MVHRMFSWLGRRKPKPEPAAAPAAASRQPDLPRADTLDAPPAPPVSKPGFTNPDTDLPHADDAEPAAPASEPAATSKPGLPQPEAIAAEPASSAPKPGAASQEPHSPPPDAVATVSASGPAQPNADAVRIQIEALIAETRFAEADSLFARLPPDLGEEWHARAGLTLARRRADHATALACATRLQAFTPSTPLAYVAASQALRALGRPRDALAHAEAGLNQFPKAPGLLTEAAQAAEAAGDADRAHAHLAALRAAQPKSPEGYVRAVQLSLRKQQPDTARTLIDAGLAAFPDDRQLRLAAARRAVAGQAWAEAAGHWAVLTNRFPEDAALTLEAATSLIGPRPGRRKRLPGVLTQLATLRERFPDFIPAYAAEISALRAAGRLEEAETACRSWQQRFPASQEIALACARVAEEQSRPGDAVALLQAARARTDPDPKLEAAYIRSLGLAGEAEAAERAAQAALQRFPQDVRVIRQHKALAAKAGNQAEVAARAPRPAEQ